MRSKATTTNHGIAIGIGLGSGGGGGGSLLLRAIFLMTACPILMCVSVDGLCIPREREALLSFKRGLTDPSNILSSWSWLEDEHPHGDAADCCHWRGVVCHNSTGHVLQLRLGCIVACHTEKVLGGTLSPSLLDLKHLTHLDLSFNDFQGIPIPRFLGSLQSLTYLNLSDGGLGGMIPQQLGNLSNLHSLDLRSSYHYSTLRSDRLGWVTGLSKLQYLDLSHVNMSKAMDWLQATNKLPSLKQLRLSSCRISSPTTLIHNFSHLSVLDLSWNSLSGPIPVGLANLTRLTTLHLSFNNFNSSIHQCLFHLHKLQVLNLRWNSLEGVIPEGVGNMTALSTLDLTYNSKLEGVGHMLIKSLGNLCSLRELRLSGIKLGREGFQAFMSLSGCVLPGLVKLELGETQLTGKLGNLVDNLSQSKNLTTLDLPSNSLRGPIPESIGRLSSLKYLFLDDNQLSGTLPESLGHLTRLRELYIFDNQLMGDVTQSHFSNLTELISLLASRNKLSLKVGPKWVPPFQIEYLDLDSWQIGPQFPQWLQSQKYLLVLRLSGVGISSTIPDWFQKSSPNCRYYNLSGNQIQGGISKFVQSNFLVDTVIDFGSSRLSGPLPPISPRVVRLHLSNNQFSGSISHFLCHKPSEQNRLELLDLGKNNMSGEISDCLMNWRSLVLINFEYNDFTGQIPSSIQSLGHLHSLYLRNNHFQGKLPTSLRNCTSLVIMDLGENDFLGRIPSWMGEWLPSLKVLNMGFNGFFGKIPHQLCALTSLQILIVTHNNLSGSIPTCFNNLAAMTIVQNSSKILIPLKTILSVVGVEDRWRLLDHAYIAMKDRSDEYSTNLGLVTNMDLSNNFLYGEIPKTLTSLTTLRSLNLSYNRLTGRIPETMGLMKALESIDLSTNQLFGAIPTSISDLTFISHFNVSNNKLMGKIPLGTQLQSLNASSFYGNQLCGPPLNDICNGEPIGDEIEQGDKGTGGGSGMVLREYSYVGFHCWILVCMCTFVIIKSWRQAYLRSLDSMCQRTIVLVRNDY